MTDTKTLKEHVTGNSQFTYFRAGVAYYVTATGMEFPVPVDELDGASLNAQEKSLMFMKWIKRHLKTLETKH